MPQTHKIVFKHGHARFIYNDALASLLTLGTSTVTRASHVEPVTGPDGAVGWQADMSPSGGPVLWDEQVDWSRVCGDCWNFPNRCDHVTVRVPFKTRSEALAAEVAWLQQHKGL